MAYFRKDFIDFFKELAANNNKEWFDANRKRYEREVKEPFSSFIGDVIGEVKKIDTKVDIEPKDAIFRINRDVRFSKDKTPYKIQCSALISRGGRKDMVSPGMYLEFSPEHVRIYGGIYMCEKDQLQNTRHYIINNLSHFKKLINDADFKSKFGEIRGEKNKVIPKEFKEAAEKEPILFNKQFYYFGQMKPEIVLKDDLMDRIMDYYKTSKPLSEFLSKAMQT